MKGKLLVITGSARGESDTTRVVGYLCYNTKYTSVNLLDKIIEPYSYNADYLGTDDFDAIIEQVLVHDIIVFATPVYWYAMSGLMKNFFDRLTDIVTVKKQTGRLLKGKSVVVIAVGADPQMPDGFEVPFRNTAQYLDMEYKGAMYFIGGTEPSIDSGNAFKTLII